MATVEEDDEDSDCLLIDEEGIQLEKPDDVKKRKLNATTDQNSKNTEEIVPIANNKQTNRNNTETLPCNIVGLMKNFNLENFCTNHHNIFNDANEHTPENIDSETEKEERIKSNRPRLSCKDFARIPFDNGSNFISSEFLKNSELYAHLTGNANTNRSLNDSVSEYSKATPNSNEGFQATASNVPYNSRRLHASDTLIQAPTSFTYNPVLPNTVHEKQDPQSGSLNMKTSEVRRSILPNMYGYDVRDENLTTRIPAAQNASVIVPPYPGGPSSTAYRAEAQLNANRLNPSIPNNITAAMSMHGYGVIPPHQNQEMHASDTLTQAPSSYFNSPVPPNTVYGNQDPQSGTLNMNTSEVRSSIPPNMNGSAIVPPYPGGPSSTAFRPVVQPNAYIHNPSIPNNIPAAMHGYEETITPHQNQEMHASDANRRQMDAQDLSAALACYDPNINVCRYPCYSGPCEPMKMRAVSRPALPSFHIPRMPACAYSASCNMQRPLYPCAQPNITMQPHFQTTDPQNCHSQARNVNDAIPRDGLYRVADPITYATYEQAYLSAMRRISNAADLPINKQQKTKAAKAKRTKITTNLGNEATINLNPIFSTSSASNQETTTKFYIGSNTVPNWEAFGNKETVINKSRAKTSVKTKTIAARNAICTKAPLGMKNHLQPNNLNIETTQTDNNINNIMNKTCVTVNADAHLPQQTVKMRIPTEHGEITLAYNMTNASIQQTQTNVLNNEAQQYVATMNTNKPQFAVNPEESKEPCTVNSERAWIANTIQTNAQQARSNINTDQSQVHMKMHTIDQIIMNTIDKTMQSNVQASISNGLKSVETLTNTKACIRQTSMKQNAESAVPLFDMNKYEALTSTTPISRSVVQASSKAPELKAQNPFTGVEGITDNINRTDIISNSITFNTITEVRMDTGTKQNIMNMNINKIRAPNIQQTNMNTNSGNPKLALITDACLQQAEIAMNTDQTEIVMTMLSSVQQPKMNKNSQRVQTSMNIHACAEQDSLNANIETEPQVSKAVGQGNYASELKEPTSSTAAKSITRNIESSELESRSNTVTDRIKDGTQLDKTDNKTHTPISTEKPSINNNENSDIPQTRGDTNSEKVQTSISMETCTHQAGSNTYIENLVTLTNRDTYRTQSTFIQTAKPLVQESLNVCELNVPTSFTTAESITHNLESSNFVPNAGNLNLETTLTTDAHTSDTFDDIIQTQHQGTKYPIEHVSIDFLRSVLYNVYRKSTLHINQANNKSIHCNVGTKENDTDKIPNMQLTEKKMKEKNENDAINKTLENKYETDSEGNIINCKSKKKYIDTEKDKFEIARQRLALLKQNENEHDESNPVEDNTQRTIVPNYDSIISSVLNRANISQNIPTPHDIFPIERMEFNDNNSCITNKDSNNVKNNQSDRSNKKKLVVTRKRKIHNDREINETDDSREVIEMSDKRNRHRAEVKENARGYSRQTLGCHTYSAEIEQKTNVAAKLRQASVAINKVINNDEIKKQTNKKSDEELNIDEFLFFQFQIEFFGRLRAHLMDNELRESADNLGYDLYNLIYISENPDAKADMEFTCPNCHYVSIYSPRLFYYKGDDHNLQKSDEIVNCKTCIGIRKKYNFSLKKYILRNTSQLETLKENTETKLTTTLIENNAKTDGRTIHSNNDCQTQSPCSNSSFRIETDDAKSAISINAEPRMKNDNDDIDKSNNKNHDARTNIRANTATTSKAGGTPKNNQVKIISTRKILASNSVSMGIEENVSVGRNEVETHRMNDKEKENEQDGKIKNKTNSISKDHNETDTNSNKVGGGLNKQNNDYDPLEEQLNIMTNGISMNSKKTIGNKPNRNSKKNVPVKLPWNKLNPSIIETIIKNRNVVCNKNEFTLYNTSNNIDENDKNHKLNPNVQNTVTAITATTAYIEACDNSKKDHELRDMISAVVVNSTNNNPETFNRNISTATNKNYYKNKNNQNNREVKKTSSAVYNDRNNNGNEKRFKARTIISVGMPTSINAELPNRNKKTTTYNNSDNANNNENSNKKCSNDKIAISTNVKTHIRSISTVVNKSHNYGKNDKVRSSTCTKTATTASEDSNNGNKDIGVVNMKKREIKKCVTESDNKNEKSRNDTKILSVETATNINAEPRKKNTIKNTKDYNNHNKTNVINTEFATAKNGDPRNRFVNTAINDCSDNNKSIVNNNIDREDAENTISINAESHKVNINVKNDNDKNHKVRKSIHAHAVTTASPNAQREPYNKANRDDIHKNHDYRKSISAETLLIARNSLASYSVNTGKENNKSISIKIRKNNVGHDDVEARGTNFKEKDKDKQGGKTGDDNDSSSKDDNENDDNSSNNEDEKESDDNSSSNEDDNKSGDEAHQTTRKAIEQAFKSLKEKCNSIDKTELPQVNIPGKYESKKNTESKDEAFKRKCKLRYSYECHKCTMPFKYLRTYYNHMRKHGINTEMVPEECVLRKCKFCGLDIPKKKYNAHIQYGHKKQIYGNILASEDQTRTP